MKAITFTTRNVTVGERNTAGEMVLRHLGDVTLTLEGMTRAEVADWADITDALNTRGINEEAFRLSVNGWKVIHPETGVVGLLFQGYGSRVHVEWYDVVNDDYFSAGWTLNLRHGAAQIVNARQHAGQGIPVDVQPEPVKASVPPRPPRCGWRTAPSSATTAPSPSSLAASSASTSARSSTSASTGTATATPFFRSVRGGRAPSMSGSAR
ncbi:hypothetical protein ACFQ0G_53945 [Streptomyces chiangmaiensis]